MIFEKIKYPAPNFKQKTVEVYIRKAISPNGLFIISNGLAMKIGAGS